MGVPVITLVGHTHAARTGASVLTAAGQGDWIAQDEDGCVRTATELARAGARTVEQREALRARLRQSPLCDEVPFVRKLEAAYRAMWQSWCGSDDTVGRSATQEAR
jgi:predicted O-linked N-acetylglucosamine transferase (SPINDLY family)